MDKDYSESSLITFLDYAGSKGIIKETTAKARKVAATKILSALDEHEKTDLRQLDRDATFQRFENKNASGFTPDSLTTYRSRFNVALDDFLRYMENRSGFKPGGTSRAARKSKVAASEPGGAAEGKVGTGVHHQFGNGQVSDNTPKISVPIPIRQGMVVLVTGLPTDLSSLEANRIAGVITALAIPTE